MVEKLFSFARVGEEQLPGPLSERSDSVTRHGRAQGPTGVEREPEPRRESIKGDAWHRGRH